MFFIPLLIGKMSAVLFKTKLNIVTSNTCHDNNIYVITVTRFNFLRRCEYTVHQAVAYCAQCSMWYCVLKIKNT